ncbi:hypothetical protein GCM10027321_12250 [Massilia terrae]|uniref:DUF1828 domain-containing protein n=1 Tax=Massilia terrae TaxID=1811224 RepID=A0ABT2D2K3_9BURK|nr:DUF1828 domain-containing protein [Massilia terrae]MCS0660457.1 DUF1828 domain-containing protein [Massilia terrae]
MISLDIKQLLGLDCDFVDDEKTLIAIHTPFRLEDSDPVPVYIEEIDGRLRFCDLGGVTWQLICRGIRLNDLEQLQFIRDLASLTGVTLNRDDELELWIDSENVNASFTRFMCAMLAMVRWEYEYVASGNARRLENAAESLLRVPVSA